jgi:hypothetical protein
VNTGFGGEVFIYKGLGVGAEAGHLAINWSLNGNDGVAVLSLHGPYHFFGKKNRRRIEPSSVGGYSLYYRRTEGDASGSGPGLGVECATPLSWG